MRLLICETASDRYSESKPAHRERAPVQSGPLSKRPPASPQRCYPVFLNAFRLRSIFGLTLGSMTTTQSKPGIKLVQVTSKTTTSSGLSEVAKERANKSDRPMRLFLLILPLFAIPACVTVNTETVKNMSSGQLCEFLGPAWISTASERDAIYREIESRGVICQNGQVAGYRSQPDSAPSQQTEPKEAHQATGSCFAVSEDEVITSHHVVAGASKITVKFQSGNARSAQVSQQSQSTDLAVLKIQGSTPAYLSLAKPRSLQVGQEIFTIGYPVAAVLGHEPKFTEGSVSALSGVGGDATFFQMSVPIQPGNSGGPVMNFEGQVVGIVAATAAVEAFYSNTGSLPQNVNWASKADYARLLFDVPEQRKQAVSRQEAIEMTMSALCEVRSLFD